MNGCPGVLQAGGNTPSCCGPCQGACFGGKKVPARPAVSLFLSSLPAGPTNERS